MLYTLEVRKHLFEATHLKVGGSSRNLVLHNAIKKEKYIIQTGKLKIGKI